MSSLSSKIQAFVITLTLAITGYLACGAGAARAASGNLDQCQNGVTTPPLQNLTVLCGDGGTPAWANGDVNSSNSQYREGDGLPYRLIVTGLDDGTHTITLEYDFTAGGIPAIDRLTRPSLTQAQDDCATGAFANCVFHSFSPDMPGEVASPSATQPALPNGGNLVVAGFPSLLSGSITNPLKMRASVPTGQLFAWDTMGPNAIQSGLASANSSRSITFTFSVGNTGSPVCNSACAVVFGWSGHIASQIDWGSGAASINGSSFHMTLDNIDGSGGKQAKSVQVSSIIQTVELKKTCDPTNDPGLFNLSVTPNNSGAITKLNATCNGVASPSNSTGLIAVNSGTATISETAGTSTSLANYTTTASCTGATASSVTGTTTRSATVTIPAGGVITCTLTNTLQRGILNVTKSLDPSSDPGKFDLYIEDLSSNVLASALNVGNNGTTGDKSLIVATYQVGETAHTGTNLSDYSSSIQCKANNGAGAVVASGSGSGPLSVALTNNADILCVITNQRNMGKIEVVKHLVPSNDSGLFDLSIDSTVYNNGGNGYGDTGSTGEQLLNTGSHTVGESQHAGTLLSGYSSSIECRGSNGAGSVVASGSGAGPLSVSVGTGDDIVCTITNTRRPRLKLIKSIVPVADGTSNKFNLFIKQGGVTVANGSVSNIGNGGSVGFLTLAPGSYSVSETAGTPNVGIENYSTDIHCDKSGFTDVTGINGAFNGLGAGLPIITEPSSPITLANGDIVTCTITNTRKAMMPIAKTVNGQSTNLQFTLSLYPDFGAPNHVSGGIFPAGSFSNPAPPPATISTPLASLNGPPFPEIVALGGPFVVCEMGLFNGSTTSNGFAAGSAAAWKVNNVSVATFDPDVAIGQPTRYRTCISGITLSPGTTVAISIDNSPPGQIIVKKVTVPATDTTTSFAFAADYNNAGFSLKNGGTNNSGTLTPETYHVTETAAAGWTLTNVHCEVTAPGSNTSTLPADGVSQPVAIGLGSGDVVTCTFTNTKRAKITLAKACLPSSDTTMSFDFSYSGASSGSTSRTCGQSAVVVGPTADAANFVNWTVTELSKTGWDLTNIQCSSDAGLQIGNAGSANSGYDSGDDRAIIHLDAGDDVTCTFTNRERGALTIVKDANPDDPQSFTFAPSSNLSGSNFTLVDNGGGPASMQNFTNLAAGNSTPYSVAETSIPNGWGLMTIACVDADASDGDGNTTTQSVISFSGSDPLSGFQSGKNTVNVTLAPGEHLTCTFTDVKLGKIVVQKQTFPGADPTLFTFTSGDVPGFPSNPSNKLSDGQSFTVGNIFPGTYHVTESLITDWDVSNITCNDSDSTGSVGTRQATYRVAISEIVTCVFQNTKRGHILVDKVTNPPGAPDYFQFDATGGSNPAYQDFSLRDQDPPNNQSLRPGTYSVTELITAGWDLRNIICTGGATPASYTGAAVGQPTAFEFGDRTAGLTLGPGEIITCVFTNWRKPELIIAKIARLGDDLFPYNLVDETSTGSSTIGVRTAEPYYENGVRIGTQGSQLVFLNPGDAYNITENLSNLPAWYMNNVTCSFNGVTFNGHPIVVNDISNPPLPRNRTLPTVEIPTVNYLDVVTCTYTNTKEATLAVTKLINGCQPNDNLNGNKCGSFPTFNFNLYNQGPAVPDPILPAETQVAPANFLSGPPLNSFTAPPTQELIEPRGVPYSVCEMGIPDSWEAVGWTVAITPYGFNKPQTTLTYVDYQAGVSGQDDNAVLYNPNYFLGADGTGTDAPKDLNNRCINLVIPPGTDTLQVYANNYTSTGRMTGGGSVFATGNPYAGRVTHGFELHCDQSDDPNNLEINWSSNKFHLDDLVSAKCSYDKKLKSPGSPTAGFNTYEGIGTGSYNGISGYKAYWVFTDQGEPGTNDTAAIKISDPSGNTTVLRVGTLNVNGGGNIINSTGVNLTFGNQQAHK